MQIILNTYVCPLWYLEYENHLTQFKFGYRWMKIYRPINHNGVIINFATWVQLRHMQIYIYIYIYDVCIFTLYIFVYPTALWYTQIHIYSLRGHPSIFIFFSYGLILKEIWPENWYNLKESHKVVMSQSISKGFMLVKVLPVGVAASL